jgi:hypothetical protein
MLGYRGAIALREKMKPLGYPNLVKAREAQMRKVAERRRDRQCPNLSRIQGGL